MFKAKRGGGVDRYSPITVASLHQKVNMAIVDLDVIAKQI